MLRERGRERERESEQRNELVCNRLAATCPSEPQSLPLTSPPAPGHLLGSSGSLSRAGRAVPGARQNSAAEKVVLALTC